MGMQKSGVSATALILKHGGSVTVYDEQQADFVIKNLKNAELLGAKITYDPMSEIENSDVLVLSPGVPVDNPVAVKARELKKRITGEFELASGFTTDSVIAITGTNGKTTTCSLVSHVLSYAGIKNQLVGNIGIPFSDKCEKGVQEGFFVAEVSSFQLETVARFTPYISCILNVTPDHLTRHYNMDNYVFLKSKLLLNLKESEFAVLNYDDEITRSLSEKTRGKTVWFSLKEECDGGYLSGGDLFFKGEKIMNASEIPVGGAHNLENTLAAICILKLAGLENALISGGVKTFKGVKHRLQEVKTVGGVTFINDSKSTNPDSLVKAVEAMKKPTVLIVGGYDKGLSYKICMAAIKESPFIKKVVATGQNGNAMLIEAVNSGVTDVSSVRDFTLAVKVAYSLAGNGWNVLLSPATSSFDEFSGYEERGDKFIEIVNTLA